MHDILITGGAGKIGTVLVTALLDLGHRVAATATRDESLAALRARVGDTDRLLTIRADLTVADGVAHVLGQVRNAGFQPTSLINNARSQDFLKVDVAGTTSRDDFLGELLMDVVVPYELTLGLAQASESRLRTVVNIGSMYGVVAPTPALYGGTLERSPINYGVAKAAMIHLTRELAVRLAPRVRVNAISFGGVEGRVDEAFRQRYAALCPVGAMLAESDTIGPVLFLLGDDSASMTGANLTADGGWTLW
jgi:NAD(P)-dependent dehydrogenase (short-subunit alcohol dehydrogenase family)